MTRKEYLNKTTGVKSMEIASAIHREYYGQFVDETIKRSILQRFTVSQLKKVEIPLYEWDKLAVLVTTETLKRKLEKCGDRASIAGVICILKEAAQQFIENETEIEGLKIPLSEKTKRIVRGMFYDGNLNGKSETINVGAGVYVKRCVPIERSNGTDVIGNLLVLHDRFIAKTDGVHVWFKTGGWKTPTTGRWLDAVGLPCTREAWSKYNCSYDWALYDKVVNVNN